MSCAHCEHIRQRQQALINEHGSDLFIGMYARTHKDCPMTLAILAEQWGYDFSGDLRATLSICECDCHGPARLVGGLPRLGVRT